MDKFGSWFLMEKFGSWFLPEPHTEPNSVAEQATYTSHEGHWIGNKSMRRISAKAKKCTCVPSLFFKKFLIAYLGVSCQGEFKNAINNILTGSRLDSPPKKSSKPPFFWPKFSRLFFAYFGLSRFWVFYDMGRSKTQKQIGSFFREKLQKMHARALSLFLEPLDIPSPAAPQQALALDCRCPSDV
jgi:hypothetical protein